MKAIWIIPTLLLLAPVATSLAETPAPAPPLIVEDMLEARLEKARFVENADFPGNSNCIELEFVLKNRSEKETIYLADRSGSTGAYQWSFRVAVPGGAEVQFGNPQTMWWWNSLHAIAIEPGKEYRSRCRLSMDTTSFLDPGGVEIYSDSGPHRRQPLARQPSIPTRLAVWAFPLKITGHFTAPELLSSTATKVATNWKGSIKTKEVTVEK